jgi:hypothetical protein
LHLRKLSLLSQAAVTVALERHVVRPFRMADAINMQKETRT